MLPSWTSARQRTSSSRWKVASSSPSSIRTVRSVRGGSSGSTSSFRRRSRKGAASSFRVSGLLCPLEARLQLGQQPAQEGGQLPGMVLHRGAGEGQAALGLKLTALLGPARVRILDGMGLVQHHGAPKHLLQSRLGEQAVAGEHHVAGRRLGQRRGAVPFGQQADPQRRREAGQLHLPVEGDAGGGHHQGRPPVRAVEQQRRRLDGLAQAHVVRQAGPQASVQQARQPTEALQLVGAQLPPEARGRAPGRGLQVAGAEVREHGPGGGGYPHAAGGLAAPGGQLAQAQQPGEIQAGAIVLEEEAARLAQGWEDGLQGPAREGPPQLQPLGRLPQSDGQIRPLGQQGHQSRHALQPDLAAQIPEGCQEQGHALAPLQPPGQRFGKGFRGSRQELLQLLLPLLLEGPVPPPEPAGLGAPGGREGGAFAGPLPGQPGSGRDEAPQVQALRASLRPEPQGAFRPGLRRRGLRHQVREQGQVREQARQQRRQAGAVLRTDEAAFAQERVQEAMHRGKAREQEAVPLQAQAHGGQARAQGEAQLPAVRRPRGSRGPPAPGPGPLGCRPPPRDWAQLSRPCPSRAASRAKGRPSGLRLQVRKAVRADRSR